MSTPPRQPAGEEAEDADGAADRAPLAELGHDLRGTSAAMKVSASVSIVAAVVVAVLINVLVARHYRRWDWTRGGLYTLSDATVETLHGLPESVKVIVLLGAGDPLTLSIDHLLQAYGSESPRLIIEHADPDRHPAEFMAVQQRYGIVPGKTDDGRVVTDAAMVITRGDKHHFVTHRDLVEVEDEQDLRARPRLEQAITAGIRNVLSGDRPRVCVASGHGEMSLEAGGDAGMAPLTDKLIKNNYDVIELPAQKALGAEKDPLPGCRLLLVAGPTQRVPREDVARYKRFLEGGGSALLFVGPLPDADEAGYLDLGLDDLLAVAGVKLNRDFVIERDPKRRIQRGFGEVFLPILKPHPITEGLRKLESSGLDVVASLAASLTTTGSAAAPAPLLVTSDQAFGMADFLGWARNPSSAPQPGPDDAKGPLTIAFATELPRKPDAPAEATHGARIVVASAATLTVGSNWQTPELRGTALFVESAVSWAAARPVILDIPNKPSFVAGLRLTDDDMNRIFWKVIIALPLAAVLLGVAVFLRRRSTERPQPKAAEADAPRPRGPRKRGGA
ncbi:MAG: GldG family protein [Polyangiaceae bacterium]